MNLLNSRLKLAIFLSAFSNISIAESIGLDVYEISRLAGSSSSSANAITVISREDIEQMGARNIPEILQYAPGFVMAWGVGNAYRVSYLNSVGQNARGIGIKVDGVSFYNQSRLGLSKIDWDEIPVDLADIEKIEIIRSPDASEFGGEAFSAMINIVTRKISSREGTSIAGSTDFSSDNNAAIIRHAESNDSVDYMVSFKREKSTGIEGIDGDHESEYQHKSIASAKVAIRPAPNQRINAYFAALEGDFDYHVHVPRNPFATDDTASDVKNYNLGLNYRFEDDQSKNLFEVTATASDETARRDLPICLPNYYFFPETMALDIRSVPPTRFAFLFGRNPFASPANGDVDPAAYQAFLDRFASEPFGMSCGFLKFDNDERSYSLELSNSYFGENSKFKFGVSGLTQDVVSPTYFPGTESENMYRAFIDGLYEVNDTYEFRYGFDYEHSNGRDALSYKVGAIQHFQYGLSTKLVYSHGEQIPGLYDSQRNGRMPFFSTDTGSIIQKSVYILNEKTHLKNEEINAVELIFMRDGFALQNTFELKLFAQRFDHQNTSGSSPLLYAPVDDGRVDVTGAELESSISPWHDAKIRLTYAYHDYDASYGVLEEVYGGRDKYEELTNVVTPRNSGSAMILQRFQSGIVVSASTVYSDEINGFRLARYDGVITYPFTLSQTYGKLYFSYRHYIEKEFGVNIADNELTGSYNDTDDYKFGFDVTF